MSSDRPALCKRDLRYDPDALPSREYAHLVAGCFRKMPSDYRIIRSSGTQDWLIILTIAGGGVIRRGAKSFPVRPRQVILFKPSLPHDYGTDPEIGHWGLVWAHFHPPSSWLPLLEWPQLAAGILCLDLPRTGRVARQIIDGFTEMHRCAMGKLPRREWLATNALEAVLLRCETLVASGDRDCRVASLADYIDKHLAEPISLAELARESNLCVSQVSTLFRHHYKASPHVYIEKRRMEEAVRLLYSLSLSIKEVARCAGFVDPLYFSRRFKKHFGVCPETYRADRINQVTL